MIQMLNIKRISLVNYVTPTKKDSHGALKIIYMKKLHNMNKEKMIGKKQAVICTYYVVSTCLKNCS